jgi:hypothetical protein
LALARAQERRNFTMLPVGWCEYQGVRDDQRGSALLKIKT